MPTSELKCPAHVFKPGGDVPWDPPMDRGSQAAAADLTEVVPIARFRKRARDRHFGGTLAFGPRRTTAQDVGGRSSESAGGPPSHGTATGSAGNSPFPARSGRA
jgi:hypothetical protein